MCPFRVLRVPVVAVRTKTFCAWRVLACVWCVCCLLCPHVVGLSAVWLWLLRRLREIMLTFTRRSLSLASRQPLMASTRFFSSKWYTKSDEWVLMSGDTFTLGVSEYAQDHLGDCVFIDLPEVGGTV